LAAEFGVTSSISSYKKDEWLVQDHLTPVILFGDAPFTAPVENDANASQRMAWRSFNVITNCTRIDYFTCWYPIPVVLGT